MSISRVTRTALAVVCIALFAVVCYGQGVTGAITGLIKDPTGASVPDASILIRNADTKAGYSAKSGTDGYYRVANLVPGNYMVEVEAPGFRKMTIAAQRLSVNQNLRVDVSMEIGQLTETVNV